MSKRLIEEQIRPYQRLTCLAANSEKAPDPVIMRRARNIATFKIDLQWIEGNAATARMNRFEFQMSAPALERYCNEIVNCLVQYAQKSEPEALAMVNDFWRDDDPLTEDDLRLHEDPYYWAISILTLPRSRSTGYDWTSDPDWYPPPKDFLDRRYPQSAPQS